MIQYNHDMMHCLQHQCERREECYRYWLGKEAPKRGTLYASTYNPEQPVTDGCVYFIKSTYFKL